MKTSTRWLAGTGIAAALFIGGVAVQSRAQNGAPIRAQSKAQFARAPELVGASWLNTAGQQPISLASRRGKVTVVEFWTFGCSNCRANLPIYARLFDKFEKRGVTVIGVHTPETEGERNPKNVEASVKQLGISYPVLLDGQSQNWRNWNQQYWPTLYLIDKAGRVRGKWIGELAYNGASGEAQVEAGIEKLLAEG